MYINIPWLRAGVLCAIGVLPIVLYRGCDLGRAINNQPLMAQILPVWALGVGVALPNLLATTTDAVV